MGMAAHRALRQVSCLHALAAAPSPHGTMPRQQPQRFVDLIVIIGQGFEAIKQTAALGQYRFVSPIKCLQGGFHGVVTRQLLTM